MQTMEALSHVFLAVLWLPLCRQHCVLTFDCILSYAELPPQQAGFVVVQLKIQSGNSSSNNQQQSQ